MNSFAQFLQQSGAGFSSLDLQLTTKTTSTKASSDGLLLPQKRLIVLEELPHLATAESQEQFRELFTNHVQSSNVKTVWIYSDVTEGNHKPQDLERHIDSSVLYAHSKILQINPATKAQLKKLIDYYKLKEHPAPFSRCIVCNTPLQVIEKEKVIDRVPEKVKKYFNYFEYCPTCNRIYWQGDHYRHMMEFLTQVLEES